MTQASGERKKRVYELARDLNLSSEALLRVLTEMDIEARSHMSTLSGEQALLVQQKFEKEKQEARSRASSRSRKRRKRKKKNMVTAEAVKTVKTTLASMDTKKARGQKKRRRR